MNTSIFSELRYTIGDVLSMVDTLWSDNNHSRSWWINIQPSLKQNWSISKFGTIALSLLLFILPTFSPLERCNLTLCQLLTQFYWLIQNAVTPERVLLCWFCLALVYARVSISFFFFNVSVKISKLGLYIFILPSPGLSTRCEGLMAFSSGNFHRFRLVTSKLLGEHFSEDESMQFFCWNGINGVSMLFDVHDLESTVSCCHSQCCLIWAILSSICNSCEFVTAEEDRENGKQWRKLNGQKCNHRVVEKWKTLPCLRISSGSDCSHVFFFLITGFFGDVVQVYLKNSKADIAKNFFQILEIFWVVCFPSASLLGPESGEFLFSPHLPFPSL